MRLPCCSPTPFPLCIALFLRFLGFSSIMSNQCTIQSLANDVCVELQSSPYVTGITSVMPNMVAAGQVLEPPYDVAAALHSSGQSSPFPTSRQRRLSVHKELGSDGVVFKNGDWSEELNSVAGKIGGALAPQCDTVHAEFRRYGAESRFRGGGGG